IFNPDSGAADRVGIRVDDDGGKTRFFKSSGEDID
ncbi:MAG: 50S ribosomal protein L24, partial [Gammaproteobacteria bacterium]|nr:50S ribosomal protein L24 [Gammaproteobacteria bacterium]